MTLPSAILFYNWAYFNDITGRVDGLLSISCRLRAVPKEKELMKGGAADNTGRNEIRVAHTTQNIHWSKSMCPSICTIVQILFFRGCLHSRIIYMIF